MASSLKVVLRRKINKDGTYPLAIRITKDRKSSFIHLGYSLKESEWDTDLQRVKKSHPNSVRLNNMILKKKSEASDTLIEMDINQSGASSKAIQKQIKPQKGHSFFAQANVYIENMQKQGKYNQSNADMPRIKHFREFLNGGDISFKEITVSLLNSFKAYLKSSRMAGKKGEKKAISERTIVNHMIVIRTIYNQAIASKIADQKDYPFGKGKISIRLPESIKIGLTAQEVTQLETVELTDPYLNHARNLWLYSFYFAGMRISDVLLSKWKDFQNERLFYAMGKNQKTGSLKVPEKAKRILEQYRNDQAKNDLIFPELKVLERLDSKYEIQRKTSYATKRLDKALQEVGRIIELSKKLTMHIARHTFGNLSGDKISIQMLQKLYRHSSITTTIGYQANFIHKDTDDALDSVIAF